MATTLIIDHPWKESFNHGILNKLTTGLEQDQKIYQVIDLNKTALISHDRRRVGGISKRIGFRSFGFTLHEYLAGNDPAGLDLSDLGGIVHQQV